jgi:dienelactone hydrolase
MDILYIYESNKNAELTNISTAIIVLPDIYGQTNYAKKTTDELAAAFEKPGFLLDYFYELTSQANDIPQDQPEQARGLMQKMTGGDFLTFFKLAVENISQQYPAIDEFIVVGFCFAGRLAFLSASEPKVTKIVSFYGAGAHTAGFAEGKTPIEFLIDRRQGDENLRVLSFFGTQDESIPVEDRQKTAAELEKAGINYQAQEYDTGHAFFQPGRNNYDEPAAQKSWQALKVWMGQE